VWLQAWLVVKLNGAKTKQETIAGPISSTEEKDYFYSFQGTPITLCYAFSEQSHDCYDCTNGVDTNTNVFPI
jgi:hypothetical protein